MKQLITTLLSPGRMTVFSLAAMTALALGQSARAGDLNPAHVPADAKWVLHIDQETLSDTKLFQGLRENQPEIMQTLRDWFQQEYGIDPRDDLQSITMFSSDHKVRNSATILMTDYDREKVMAQLEEHDTLKEEQVDGNTLYVFQIADDAKLKIKNGPGDQEQDDQSQNRERPLKELRKELRTVAVYLGDGMIVIGSDTERAGRAIQLVNGEAESLEGSNSPLIARAPEGAVIYGAAIELGDLERFHMLLPVLQQHEQAFYAFGRQEGGPLFEQITLHARNENVASETVQVLEGLIAYQTLAAGDSQAIEQLANNTRLSRDGTTTYVNWSGEAGTLVEAIGAIADRVYQWVELAANTGNQSRQ